MKRRLFNLAAAVSLLLCVATVADWCSHPWGSNRYTHCREWSENDELVTQGAGIATGRGIIGVVLFTTRQQEGPSRAVLHLTSGYVRLVPQSALFIGEYVLPSGAFDVAYRSFKPGSIHSEVYAAQLPSWFVALLLATLPSIWLHRWRRRRRMARTGLCLRCGYDLRATPDRCPECGTEAKPQPAEGAAA